MMTLHLLCATAIALPTSAGFLDGMPASALIDGDHVSIVPRSKLATKFAPMEAAWGVFNDSYATIGWSKFEVHSNPALPDAIGARAAGVLEGKLTAHRILEAAINNGVGPGMTPDKNLARFFKIHEQWASGMANVANESSATEAAYWHHMGLVDAQLAGLHEGYEQAARDSHGALPSLPFESILYLNLGEERADFADFRPGVGIVRPLPTFGALEAFEAAGKCSALVRLTKDDVMIAQETWSSLSSMLRVYKMYDLPFTMRGDDSHAGGRVPAARVSFSSYPAVLNSGDDFYVTSAGLVVQETTIGNSNPELTRAFVSPLTVPEWKRNILANRLASSGFEWSGLYSRYNSGTCKPSLVRVNHRMTRWPTLGGQPFSRRLASSAL